jgi:hypothetical protein
MASSTDDNRSVVVEVELKPDDVYTPFRWNRSNVVRWVAAVTICMICYDLYENSSAALLSFPDGKSILAVAALLVLFVLLALLIFPYLRHRAMFRKWPALSKKRRYTFGAAGITIESDDANSDCKWSLFQRAVETPLVFTFFTTSRGGTYIPKRSFASAEDVTRMRNLIRQNMTGKYQLRPD